MSQYDFGTIDPSTKSGTGLASDLNSWRTALHSLHSGTSRPSYAVAGTLWIDTTSSPWTIRIFDGSDDIAIGTVDATANSFAVTLNDSAVTTAKINNGAVTVAKLATVAGNAGKLVAYDASGVPTVVSAGTDTYPLVSNGTALAAFEQLATGGIANAAVTVAKISASGSTSGEVLTSTGSGTAPAFGQLTTSGIANSAVTVAKISAAGSTAGQVLTSTGSSTAPAFQALSAAIPAHLSVGSYAILVNSSSSVTMTAGSSYTSNLRYGVTLTSGIFGVVQGGSSLTDGTAISGQTWMCMGSDVRPRWSADPESPYTFSAGLFLRTA